MDTIRITLKKYNNKIVVIDDIHSIQTVNGTLIIIDNDSNVMRYVMSDIDFILI